MRALRVEAAASVEADSQRMTQHDLHLARQCSYAGGLAQTTRPDSLLLVIAARIVVMVNNLLLTLVNKDLCGSLLVEFSFAKLLIVTARGNDDCEPMPSRVG